MPKMKYYDQASGQWIPLDANDADTLDGKHADYFDNKIGTLSNLNTTDKTSVVNAVNEIHDEIDIHKTDNTIHHTSEEIQDIVGALIQAGSNISINYDDNAGIITISSTGTQLITEEVQDIVGTLVTAGNGVSVNYDDTNNTLTINADVTSVNGKTGVVNLTANDVNAVSQIDFNAHLAEDVPHQYGNRFAWKYNSITDSLDLVVIE